MRLPLAAPSTLRAAAGAFLLVAGAGAAPMAAQECAATGERAYVCEVDLYAAPSGERMYALEGRWGVQLAFGERWDLEIEARDQWGRRFPSERMALGIEADDRCEGIVEVEQRSSTTFRLAAGAERGDCRVWLWVPGNLNLEWSLDVRVVARAGDDYSRTESEWVTTALYRALLGREPDPSGRAVTTAEIQRGRLADVIRAIAASPEYRSRVAGRPASEILEQIYQGLLGRAPGSPGVRSFLSWVERGAVVEVVWEIVKSEEFERRLVEAAGR